MSTETRQAHLSYLNKSMTIFHSIANALGERDAATIRKYGCWYEALDKGVLPVMSEAQSHFVQVAHGKTAPITKHELLWVKYKKLLSQAYMNATPKSQYSRAHGNYGSTAHSTYDP